MLWKGGAQDMSAIKYKRAYCASVREYFGKFIGYWERRLEAIEERLAREAWEDRASELARRQSEAVERGEHLETPIGELLDPESVKQAARIRAYEALEKEMATERRMRGLPSFEKWAKVVGVNPSTVSRWRELHPEFDEACRDCDRIQVDILRDGGLSGIYAGRTATFLIKLAEEREAARSGSSEMRFEDFEDA